MLFNSVDYLLFFPIVSLLYFIIPKKLRNIWLLAASYFFYMNWNAKYALLLAFSTIVTYGCALFIDHVPKEKKWIRRCGLWGCIFINLGLLFYFKYTNFIIENINRALRLLHQDGQLPLMDIVLPVGISFFIFQALGYTIDVYRQSVKPTKNVFRYALFVSFFPQLVAGPIERSANLLPQFEKTHTFDVERIRRGLLQMLWGLFMKIVIADNLAGTVTMIYDNYGAYSGVEIVLATMMFAIQIYCDFGGYSNIAIGSAKVLGFTLMENFQSPYISESISEFWRRWHISLTKWFTDYVYIPLGGSRKGQIRTIVNTLIVFFVSGLWHGAQWTFIAWGVLNGIYLIAEKNTIDVRRKLRQTLHIKEDTFSYHLWQRIYTFFWVSLSWMFFRATGLKSVLLMLRQIVTRFEGHKLFGWTINNIGMEPQTLIVVLIAITLLFVVDDWKYKGNDAIAFVFRQGFVFRWCVYLGLLFTIIMFGAYGYEFTQTEFIYFQF